MHVQAHMRCAPPCVVQMHWDFGAGYICCTKVLLLLLLNLFIAICIKDQAGQQVFIVVAVNCISVADWSIASEQEQTRQIDICIISLDCDSSAAHCKQSKHLAMNGSIEASSEHM